MSLLDYFNRRRMPRPGEQVQIFQHHRLLAAGVVVSSDSQTVTVAGDRGLIDLDTEELRRGLYDGSIVIQREP